jgi:predicted phosphoribosyltransferase
MKNDALNIIERSDTPFQDRLEAGQMLGWALKHLYLQPDIVLGIPRGGVIIAQQLSHILKTELDIVLTRKIGAPQNPELAIGAIGEEGHLYLNDDLVEATEADADYILRAKKHELAKIAERQELFRATYPRVPLKGKTVIITDDGVATGATLQAAVWTVGQENPKKIIIAVPVGSLSSLERLAQDGTQVICLRVPAYFRSVGEFYEYFDQIDDERVQEILRHSNLRKG